MISPSRQRATVAPRSGFAREYLGFLRSTGKWWLLPVVIVMVVLGLLVMLAGTGAAPFIYTLF